MLSFKIYIPFKRILDKYSTSFNDGNQLGGTNEYQMMECLFSNASDKIDNFKNILKKNESMIRHNFLVDILNKHFKNPDNMKDIINFAGINFNKQYYSVTFLTFNSRQANNAIKQQQIQYIKYSIIDYINSIESTLYHLYPVDTGSTSVSVITNSDVNNRDVIKQLINDIEKYCIDNFKFYLIAGTGRFVNTHFDLHLSYTDAKTCILYKFLKPDQYAFNYEHVSLISQNKVTLDDNNPKKLRKYLNMENIASIEKLVAQFLDYIESDKILYHDAKKEISRYVKVYTQYISEKKIKLDDIADEETKIRFTAPVSANDFIETFIQLIKSTFSYTSNKKLNKNSILAEKAKQYVLENIHMDLSLISAASAFNISPYHLSRIFKEENGISYIDYVVNCKIANQV